MGCQSPVSLYPQIPGRQVVSKKDRSVGFLLTVATSVEQTPGPIRWRHSVCEVNDLAGHRTEGFDGLSSRSWPRMLNRGKLDNGTGREKGELGKLRQGGAGAPSLWPEDAGAERGCW